MIHLVYKVTNNLNQMFYIGVHSTENEFDNYLGSGFRVRAAIRKHGAFNFTKEILFKFNTRIEALLKEAELVDTEMLKNELCYNLVQGGASQSQVKPPSKFDEEYKWVFKPNKKGVESWIQYTEELIASDPEQKNELITLQRFLLPQTEEIWGHLMNDITRKFNSKRTNKSAMKILNTLHHKNLIDCLYVEQIPWETT
jgi:hypothetical protein